MPIADDELFSAVQRWYSNCQLDGGMVTKFFLIAEGMTDDGDLSLDYAWTQDMKTWHVRGFIDEVSAQQLSGQLADQLMEEDDS